MNIFEIKYNKKFPYIHLSFNNLFAIFFNALIVGVGAFIFETLLDFAITGNLYDRGFLIGPFIPIYFFMVFLGLLFFKIPLLTIDNLIKYFFIIGFSISAFEFIVGNLCELITGAVLWSYDGFLPLSYKYVSLTAACFWGILGTFYLVFIVPFIKKFTDKISLKIKKLISLIFLILFVIDIIISFLLVIINGGYQELYVIYSTPSLAYLIILIILLIFIFSFFGHFILFKRKKNGVLILIYIFFILLVISFIIFLYIYL